MKLSEKSAVLLLTAALLFSSCASGGDKTKETEAAAKSPAVSEPVPGEETEAETEDPIAARTLQDSVPALDFVGASFRSISQDGLPPWISGRRGNPARC